MGVEFAQQIVPFSTSYCALSLSVSVNLDYYFLRSHLVLAFQSYPEEAAAAPNLSLWLQTISLNPDTGVLTRFNLSLGLVH